MREPPRRSVQSAVLHEVISMKENLGLTRGMATPSALACGVIVANVYCATLTQLGCAGALS